MQCPTCIDAVLAMTSRQGVEIDYCPNCRGVWLDRGELDKLIERAGNEPPPRPQASSAYRDFDDSGYRQHGGRPHKRRSWLGELFD